MSITQEPDQLIADLSLIHCIVLFFLAFYLKYHDLLFQQRLPYGVSLRWFVASYTSHGSKKVDEFNRGGHFMEKNIMLENKETWSCRDFHSMENIMNFAHSLRDENIDMYVACRLLCIAYIYS